MSGSFFTRKVKDLFIGRARDISEQGLFHKTSLVALLAWVGLGADGLSSSCYGPEETYKALLTHPSLALIVALMAAATVAIICASYSQIISLFPSGGGGYVVATRLLGPTAGVVSGSALVIDYVLTIAISAASASDALFSLLPAHAQSWKLLAAFGGILLLVVLNLRGVRESVLLWAPVFFVFLGTHFFAVLYAVSTHADGLVVVAGDTVQSVRTSAAEVGWLGVGALLLRAYSMGAGTYTGIEAVSNGLPILREPRVRTGRRTMVLMAVSLGAMVVGLLVAYLVAGAQPMEGRTLNAVLFDRITAGWPEEWGHGFTGVALGSAAALLLIAAQAGFLDGPRVLASMAIDRWMPGRFASLSDRFVTLNGVLLMGGAALVVLLLTRGVVHVLVVLYSINVFITFSLSQLGMVRHWWKVRATAPEWRRRCAINAIGLALTSFILVTLVVLKFHDGGWATLLVTGVLVAAAFGIRRHYFGVGKRLRGLNRLAEAAARPPAPGAREFAPPAGSAQQRTAVVLVGGFNGLGLHTLLGAVRLFGGFGRYLFVQVGVVDAGNFKGASELDRLREHVEEESAQYVGFVRARGGEAHALTTIGHEVIGELERLLPEITARFPDAVFLTGQLVFERDTFINRLLHNFTGLELQRRLATHGLPCAVVPVRVGARREDDVAVPAP